MCYECLLKLGKLIKFENEIKQIKKEMAELFQKLGGKCSITVLGKYWKARISNYYTISKNSSEKLC